MSNMKIYGVSDKTGSCPFYTEFFKEKQKALEEMEKQMCYAQVEFGFSDLFLRGDNVINENNKIIFSVETYNLK